MSDHVVVVSPNGNEYHLGPAEVASGRLADLQARGYKKRSAPKGPSSNVRPSVPSAPVVSPPKSDG